jgi:hypothetical protein
LPDFVNDIPTPKEVGTLAAHHQARELIELEGELEAFRYVDLDSVGLSEYRAYLQARGISDLGASKMNTSASATRKSTSLASSSVSESRGVASVLGKNKRLIKRN